MVGKLSRDLDEIEKLQAFRERCRGQRSACDILLADEFVWETIEGVKADDRAIVDAFFRNCWASREDCNEIHGCDF